MNGLKNEIIKLAAACTPPVSLNKSIHNPRKNPMSKRLLLFIDVGRKRMKRIYTYGLA
jgi:hypothetical protein